ncbi:10927_t:CDS:2 [Gigaspora rosea]|nr:10927_t:CDS:2 [Gigaspora rosea]
MAHTIQYRKRDYLSCSFNKSISSLFQEINDSNGNIILVVDDDQHANDLQPLYCNLHRKREAENVNTHVIVTGRGISGKELIKSNSLLSNCDVPVYDLKLQKGDENILMPVIKEISDILNQIRPDVLIYINDPKNEAIRGVDAALVAVSQINNTITKIALPIDQAKYMTWLTDLSIEALKSWNTPKIQIQVITQNRPRSLSRLMQSLNSSIYFDDNVHLMINIDRKADPITIKYCQTFEWPYGPMNIKYRIQQGGLITAVVESYYPTTNDDYAIILEDDIEVSPFFYIWAKYGILKYRYGNDKNLVSRLYGISLYNTRLNEFNITTGRRPFNAAEVLQDTKYPNNSPYLSQIPCSWGVLFFPEIWREFHDYLNARLEDIAGPNLQQIEVPESRSNIWRKNSWKRYFIELIYLRGYLMLYPNYENFISFSTNHAEKGMHFGFDKLQKGLWLLPLMEEDMISKGLPDNHLPNYKDLPIMDFWGHLVTQKELIRRGRSFHSEISICPPNDSDELTYDPRDLLCVDTSTLSNDVNTNEPTDKKKNPTKKNNN